MGLHEYKSNLAVSITSIELAETSARDVSALIDDLKEEFTFVNVTHTKHPPPLAGSDPTILTLVSFAIQHWDWFVAGAGTGAAIGMYAVKEYASGFLGELGKLHAGRFDEHMAERVAQKKPEDDGQTRNYALLVIKVEKARFVFDETIDAQEYVKRRKAAAEFIKKCPDNHFGPSSGPPEENQFWYYWSEKKQNWAQMSDARSEDHRLWLEQNKQFS